MILQSRLSASALGAALAVITVANAWADNDDPSGRAARLSYTHGTTSFSPAGETEWVDTVVNRPLVSGDRLWTDKDGRAELEVGSSAMRLDANTSFELVNLDDQTTQVELTQGTLNVRLRQLAQGQNYEIDTPTLAVTLAQAGQYRIEVDPDGQHTTVGVTHGSAQARGDNADYPLQEGDRIRFHSTNLSDAEQLNASAPDEFDRFSAERDVRGERGASIQYVGNDVVGASDLDEYGSWSAHGDYGHVWYPSHVESNWAPYSDGRWIWQDPWGWTWVDNAPWGFAPSHYGRWVSVDNRWGWVPGPRGEQAVYAPALVAFVGGGGLSIGISAGGAGPIGWFALGAREIYEPSYHTSRDYFTRVNVTNTTINNTTINNVYNNYSSGQPLVQANYVNRVIPGAVTAVPGNVFANAQPVRAAAIKMDTKQLASAQVTRMAAVAPSARSVIGNAPAAKAAPSNAVLERKVIARTAPPAKPVPFAARQQELQRTPGRPLARSAVAALQPRTGAAAQNVRVLGPQAGAVNARTAGPAHAAPALEPKASSQASAASQPQNARASDQKHPTLPAPAQQNASTASEPKHKVASPPPQQSAATRTQQRSAAASAQQQATSARAQERKAASAQQQQQAESAQVHERKTSAAQQQQQESAHVQERKTAAAVQPQQAASAQAHERKTSATQQQQQAESAHVQERKTAAAAQQQQAASAQVHERKTAAAATQQQQAASAQMQERKTEAAAQHQRAASAQMQERKTAAAATQQQQRAESTHAQERKAAAAQQPQQQPASTHAQERKTAAAAAQQHNEQPAPKPRNAPAAHEKAKDTNKKDENKDPEKDRGGGQGGE